MDKQKTSIELFRIWVTQHFVPKQVRIEFRRKKKKKNLRTIENAFCNQNFSKIEY